MERNMKYIYISRTTQRTNTGQVPACSQDLSKSSFRRGTNNGVWK